MTFDGGAAGGRRCCGSHSNDPSNQRDSSPAPGAPSHYTLEQIASWIPTGREVLSGRPDSEQHSVNGINLP